MAITIHSLAHPDNFLDFIAGTVGRDDDPSKASLPALCGELEWPTQAGRCPVGLGAGAYNMSGSVSGTFGNFFDQLFSMLDRWEFWGRLLLIVVAFAIFNGVTAFFRHRIMEASPSGDDAYARADGQARIWAMVVIIAMMLIAVMIADAMDSGY